MAGLFVGGQNQRREQQSLIQGESVSLVFSVFTFKLHSDTTWGVGLLGFV